MEVIPEDLKADLRKVSSVEVILGHTFRVWHNGRSAKDYWVRLTPDSLILSPTRTDDDHTLPGLCCICPAGCGRCCLPRGPDEVLKCSDIVACRPAQQEDTAQYMKKSYRNKVKPEEVGHPVFMILAYPMVNKKTGKRARKVLYFHHMSSAAREAVEFQVRKKGNPSPSEAVRIRDTWVHSILTTFFPSPNEEPSQQDIWSPLPPHMHPRPPQRRLLIVLNPSAGTGSATKIMSSVVGPILQETGIEYEVLITERQGHAHEIVQAEPHLAKRWKGIAVVGGDGTFYEVLNGIFARPDWQDVFKQVPLSVIPSGSGNGLVRSIIHEQGEAYDKSGCITSTLNVAKGNKKPLDLYLAETKADDGVQQNVGFLHISYGAIADIDIESEVLRSLGEFRFTIFTLLRVAKLRKYKAKLWYKPVKKPTTQSLKSDDETILDDTGSEPTTMEHMEEGEETIKFKEALEPESEIEEDSSDKEDSATNEGTESVKGESVSNEIPAANKDPENNENDSLNDSESEAEEVANEKSENKINEKSKVEVVGVAEDPIGSETGDEAEDEAEEDDEDEGEREVQEVTLPTEKKEMRLQNHFHVEQQDDELDIINTTNVYFDGAYPPPNPRGTYGSLLTQGHLYFRSWNELQAQVMPLPVVPPTPTPEKVPYAEFHTSPPPPLPPVRPPRQKLNTDIPELSQELKSESHDGWIFEQDEFVAISLINLPFIDGSAQLAPEASTNDGRLHLMIIRKEVQKSDLLKLMSKIEEGKHESITGVEMIPVTSFRLIPQDLDSGYLTTDGESIPIGPIQAQILPSIACLNVK